MKRMFFGLVLSLVAGLAIADTINLQPEQCGTLKQCIAVPNDSTTTVDIYGAPGYNWFYVYLTDVDAAGVPHTVEYRAEVASGVAPLANVPMIPGSLVCGPQCVWVPSGQPSILFNSDGFTSYRTCNRSGRGQYCITHWSFLGGSIVR
jgi:hypothetical protein